LKVGAFVEEDILQVHFSIALKPVLAAIALSEEAVESSMKLSPQMTFLYLHEANISSFLLSETVEIKPSDLLAPKSVLTAKKLLAT
jgi:hypothetical protein